MKFNELRTSQKIGIMFKHSVQATSLLVTCLLSVSLVASCGARAELLVPKVEANRMEATRISDMKARGENARRSAEARERRWDRKMKTLSESICVGC